MVHQDLHLHRPRVSNGPTQALNNLIKRIKRIGLGFRNFENYRIRSLPAVPSGPNPKVPPRIPRRGAGRAMEGSWMQTNRLPTQGIRFASRPNNAEVALSNPRRAVKLAFQHLRRSSEERL